MNKDFRKILKISNFIEIRPVEAVCSMRTATHDKANFRFSQFCEYAQKCKSQCHESYPGPQYAILLPEIALLAAKGETFTTTEYITTTTT
jgi:hypothetical protein